MTDKTRKPLQILHIIEKGWVGTWENQALSVASGSAFPLQYLQMPKAQAA